MKKNDQEYLKDILAAIKKINSYVKDVKLDEFVKEDMRHDAVLYQMEIIGEAANKLSKKFRKDSLSYPVKQAVEMRNFLIHGYDQVNLKVVWKTIEVDLPDLQKRTVKLLK